MSRPTTPIDPFWATRRAFVAVLPTHFQRLSWSADQVRAHQTTALRELVRVAVERSPFHARRLAAAVGDVDTLELADLVEFPVMTKVEMMSHYDEVTTDRRLTRDAVETFLADVGDEPNLLFDEYLVLASGGSSGVRGVFAWHRDLVPDYLAAILRAGLARAGGGHVPHGIRTTFVAARSAIHATRCTTHIADGSVFQLTYAPATLPLDQIVGRVQDAQPDLLAGYATSLEALAHEQHAGRLSIRPQMVVSTGEQLTETAREAITAAFGTPPSNAFGSSEGLNGSAVPGDHVFTFASDTAYAEFVDEHDRHVPIGTPAHHVLVANLVNTTQPLIRYRLDDSMTPRPAAPGNGHQRATLQGRCDEAIRFGDRQIHPIVVRTVLAHHAHASEYQVRTSPHSMDVAVITSGPLDIARLTDELACSLAAAGVTSVDVTVAPTDHLTRDPRTGKLRRFIADH
jgi:phenylacetate-CoA ligase